MVGAIGVALGSYGVAAAVSASASAGLSAQTNSAYTIVPYFNSYELPPDRHPPQAAGPVTNVSTLEGCEAHCTSSAQSSLRTIPCLLVVRPEVSDTERGLFGAGTATKGCVQFAWNYGAGAHLKPRRWYCEISSATTWGGYPSDHITSGCLSSVKDCGMTPPPPPPVPAPAPTPWTPHWSATVPNGTNSTKGYPLLAPDKVVHTYVCKCTPTTIVYLLKRPVWFHAKQRRAG